MSLTAVQLVASIRRAWPSSPILDKEMRVSSRRVSSYLLRAAYLACLTFFVAVVWMDMTRDLHDENPSYVAAHMAGAGQAIVVGILWFQFVAAQVLALFMLAVAIPSEIVRGTMITLACTPLSTFGIVLGKLFSKLLQVALLVAMSLPLLAVVRVFGGVPWGTVLAGLAATLSSAFLVGSWSLMLSVRSRSVLRILVLTALVYLPFPLLLGCGFFGPVATMEAATRGMMRGWGFSGAAPVIVVIVNCVSMIAVGLLFLRRAARRLREEIAIPTGTVRRKRAPAPYGRGSLPPDLARPYVNWPGNKPSARPAPVAGVPARPPAVKGPALIWKDLRTFLPATPAGTTVAIVLAGFILLATYIPLLVSREQLYIHWVFIFVYLVGGCFMTVLASSTAITVEKESRALAILLTAPISDTQIILAKSVGVFYRALACWGLLALHLFFFTAAGQIHPGGALGLALVAACLCVFLTGLGLYVSSMLRSSSNAMLWTLGICVGLWWVLPALIRRIPWELQGFAQALLAAFNPFTQVYILCGGAIGEPVDFRWSTDHAWRSMGLPEGVTVLLVSAVLYAGMGLLLARRARTMMRRRLFV